MFVVYVVVQFYPWFKFYFPLFLGMVMYDNEFKTKENKIRTKDKIEPQHIHASNKTARGVAEKIATGTTTGTTKYWKEIYLLLSFK